ncbi:MAG: pantoate--beta-alanine ligase [Planctomycetota bacterium]
MSGTGSGRTTAAVALGANLGEPERTFKRALSLLEREGDVQILRRSQWHATEAVGGPADQPAFLNGAILVETKLGPEELLQRLRSIEDHLGRDRSSEEPWGPRLLDLDLLWAEREGGEPVELRTDDLVLPHPRMEERSFVLVPLAEVAPDHVLARSRRTVADQLAFLQERGGLARLDTPDDARAWCEAARAGGATLGFVPTMGALHEGHLDLVRRAARENDRVCVSVFVNPLQFDDASDLESYPRDMDGDAAKLASVGCSMVFTGTLEQFFPGQIEAGELPEDALVDPGRAAEGLEGAYRTGHFHGVATIVDRLFDVVEPTRAYFGAKDFQQCLVVEDVARRRGGQPAVARCPIVREPSGLAMSSRNARLSDEGRAHARVLSKALDRTRSAWRGGLRDADELAALLRAELQHPAVEIDYAAVRDPGNWTADAPTGLLERAVALVAARVDGVRLIDNMELSAEPSR